LSPEAFSQPVSYHVFRPLASFTFALSYMVNGLNPVGYRLVNIIFHAMNCFLLFLVLQQIGFAVLPAAAGALVFAVHPVHTEAVTWISGRGNVLFLFFFLLSYLLYARMDDAKQSRRWLPFGAALVSYALSLLAKEMALPLPALLFGHDLYIRKRLELRKRVWLYMPFLFLAVVYVVLRAHVLGRVEQVAYHGGSAYATFLVMVQATMTYIRLLFVPVGLSLSRHFAPVQSLFEGFTFTSLCGVIAIVVATIILYRPARYVSFAIFWFVVAMLPVSNIIPLNAIVADRFLYGPSIAFCIGIAVLVTVTAGMPARQKSLASAALVGTLCLLMLLSIGRNNDWSHPLRLWSKTAESSPTSYVAFNNLAFEYMKTGRIPEAIEALNKALALRDDLPETHVNLARCYAKLGRKSEAAIHYKIALTQLGDDPSIQAELQSLRGNSDSPSPNI
jgi:tetratricopeptide (TPR) repeat protein